MGTIHRRTSEHRPADVLVVFGISGDLAKVMTFRSLYRLERRGLLTCPVVGVAVDDWSTEDLREHARKAIEATGEPVDEQVFERFAGRLSRRSARPRARCSTWKSRRSCSAGSSRAWPRPA
jgi:glucose-6-phosphate 1-dehydrogenase